MEFDHRNSRLGIGVLPLSQQCNFAQNGLNFRRSCFGLQASLQQLPALGMDGSQNLLEMNFPSASIYRASARYFEGASCTACAISALPSSSGRPSILAIGSRAAHRYNQAKKVHGPSAVVRRDCEVIGVGVRIRFDRASRCRNYGRRAFRGRVPVFECGDCINRDLFLLPSVRSMLEEPSVFRQVHPICFFHWPIGGDRF
jgi:hypothetical protein